MTGTFLLAQEAADWVGAWRGFRSGQGGGVQSADRVHLRSAGGAVGIVAAGVPVKACRGQFRAHPMARSANQTAPQERFELPIRPGRSQLQFRSNY